MMDILSLIIQVAVGWWIGTMLSKHFLRPWLEKKLGKIDKTLAQDKKNKAINQSLRDGKPVLLGNDEQIESWIVNPDHLITTEKIDDKGTVRYFAYHSEVQFVAMADSITILSLFLFSTLIVVCLSTAVMIAGLPYTQACSPKKNKFPGAFALALVIKLVMIACI